MSQPTTTAAPTATTAPTSNPLAVAAQVVSVVGSLVRLAVRTR